MTTTPAEPHDGQSATPIAEPLRPSWTQDAMDPGPDSTTTGEPAPAVATAPVRSAGPGRLRVGLVAGAAAGLAVVAAATSFAASPAPSSSATTASGGIAAPVALADPTIGGDVDGFDHGRFGGPGGFNDITISAISGSNVTLKTDDGWTRTIAVTSSVELTKGGQPIEVSDLKVGDEVRFSQTRNDDGTYTVTAIAVVVPSVRGTVSDVTASGFKVTTRDGSVWTITVDGSTTYRLGLANGTKADVTNGATVLVQGESTGDNKLGATSVTVAADKTVGTVTAKTSSTITIQTRDGKSVTVKVDADTVYQVAGVTDPGLDDITVDMVVGVQGATNSDGSISADAVVTGGRGLGHDGMPGMMGGGGHGGFGGRGWGDDDAAPTPSPTTSS